MTSSSDTRPATSWLGRYWLEVVWVVVSVASLWAMVAYPGYETVPFHVIWVSFTLLYGYRVWPWRPTISLMVGICLVTGLALLRPELTGKINRQEATEVPLMAIMFLAMVWHAQRRQAASEAEQRMARAQRETLERERAFVRDASHELKTPITVARGHVELVQAATLDPQIAEDSQVALRELDRLARISEGLLTLARLGQPGELRPVEVDLSELLGATARRWSQVYPGRRWVVDVRHDGAVLGDMDRLEVLLDALIDNAVAATTDGQRIMLQTYSTPTGTAVAVADEGIGLAPSSLPRVFDRFWRLASRNRTGGGSGSGLGLSIVKAVAEAHGGSVSVTSRLGQGSTFTVLLPGGGPGPFAVGGQPPPDHAHREPGSPARENGERPAVGHMNVG